MILPFQIYRHFKGNYYLVTSVALTSSELEPTVVYMSLYGDNQVWTRSLSEFESLVPEGKENPTGQKHRFELVKDMRFAISQCTTESLVAELRNRPDSPFNELDIDGFNDKVVDREYLVGELVVDSVCKRFVPATTPRDTLEESQMFVANYPHRCSSRTKIYKSILVEVQSFD